MADSCKLCGEEKSSCGKTVKARFCPKCKSVDVGFVFEIGNLFGLIPRMKCYKCGFSAIEFPMLVIGKDKLDKQNKMKNKTKKRIRRKR